MNGPTDRPQPGAGGRNSFVGRAIVVLAVLVTGIAGVWIVVDWQRSDFVERAAGLEPSAEIGGEREILLLLSQSRRCAERGEFERAFEFADSALERQPGHVPSLILKSELLFRLHRADEMIPLLQMVLQQDPEHFESRANLAWALHYAGQLDEAESQAQWCLQRQPDFTAARRVLASVWRDRGDSEKALAEVERALSTSPNDTDCRLLQADLLMYQRDYEGAFQALSPLATGNSVNPRILMALERASRLTGRDDAAARFRERLNR